MKKWLLVLLSMVVFSSVLAQYDSGIAEGGLVLSGFWLLILIIGALGSWVLTSYGLMLIAKKLEPSIHPALSWIPVVNLYVFVRVSGQSLWWLLALLGVFIPLLGQLIIFGVSIFLAYHIAVRCGKGVGTTIGLVLLSVIFVPWLGRTIYKKSTGGVIAAGIITIVITIIGSMVTGVGAAGIMMDERVQGMIEENMGDNPELERMMEDLRNGINEDQ